MDKLMFVFGFGCGGAVIWFGKDVIMKMVIGANALSAKLHAKADAIAPSTPHQTSPPVAKP